MGMDVAWPYKKRELGDTITYTCPSKTLTWEEHLEHQVVTCIWHRQTDSMIWWPPELHSCNRKITFTLSSIGAQSEKNKHIKVGIIPTLLSSQSRPF